MSFSLSNYSQKLPFFAVLMYVLYGHPGYFKFKRKHQQHGSCFQTIFLFLMTMLKQNDNRDIDMLENNISFLQQELRSKKELIKSLMVLETISKQNQFKAKKMYIGNLNENVTNEDIYKLFGLKTTEYLCQTSIVDWKISEKAEKNWVLALLLYQNLSRLNLSRIVYEVIRTISSLFILFFFYKKILSVKKHPNVKKQFSPS